MSDLNMTKRNYEWRSIPSVPKVEVTRDGEVRYARGKEQYDSRGSLIRPERFITYEDGHPMSIQMLIFKAFPDIPMRYVPTR